MFARLFTEENASRAVDYYRRVMPHGTNTKYSRAYAASGPRRILRPMLPSGRIKPMTPRQIELLQTTFQRVMRISAHFAATFYAELFAIDPSARAKFKGDMIRQGHALMATLAHVVETIGDRERMAPLLRDLAVRHVGYGVEPRHYPMVGTALLRTLKHELGGDFTQEAREAWASAYKIVSDIMLAAANDPDAIGAANPAASPRH